MQHRADLRLLATAVFLVTVVLLTGCGTPPTTVPTNATTVVTLAGVAVPTTSATKAPSAAATVAGTNSGGASKNTIVLGDFSNTPAKTVTNYQPVADYLGANLGKYGITNGTVKVAPDFDTLVKWLKSGEVDLVFDTPYTIVLLIDAAGAQPILRRWKGGDADWYTIVFARADSGMKSLADLRGKMLAVQDAYSTSGYFLPLAHLARSGIKTSAKESTDASIASDEVGYITSQDDDNTLQWVISGKVAAGATDFRPYAQIPEATRKQFVVLLQSDKVIRNVTLARP